MLWFYFCLMSATIDIKTTINIAFCIIIKMMY